MELTDRQKNALAQRRANDPLYLNQTVNPMSFEVWNTPVSGNLYAEALKNRGIPQKADLPTLGRGPAELRLSAASAPGPGNRPRTRAR